MGALCQILRYAALGLAWFGAGGAAIAAPKAPMEARVSADLQRLVVQIERQAAPQTARHSVILALSETQNISAILQAHGATPGPTGGSLLQISVQGSELPGLIHALPDDVFARRSYPHHPSQVISQGTAITGAVDFLDMGTDGAGVAIGIIDTGFAGLFASQASGELPAGQQFTDYTVFPAALLTDDSGTDHGTNVAEIVHDVAPGAVLHLAKISTDLELALAVDAMIAAGVDVIHHTLAWFGAAFYDGSGPICDTADYAEAEGVLWINAAGNLRLNHYLGDFSDVDGNLQHEFSPGQNYNTVVLQAGQPIQLVLNWDAYQLPMPPDYDLFLFDGDPLGGATLVASSENAQSGGFPLPYETLDYLPADSGTFYVVVGKQSSATADLSLSLFSTTHDLGVNTTASSLAQPADCASVVTVGATALDDTPEPTSSEGPTTDGRDKPDIAAPTGVETSRTAVFSGTSASSSYVAGAAALLFAQKAFCALSLSDMRDELVNSTHDVGTAGFDFRTGNGRLSLDADGDDFSHDTDNCAIIANASQTDTDGDQMGDACDSDDDNDGLTDSTEAAIGTDPLLADTDSDGLTDGDEINLHGTDPLLIDTDGDGAGDAIEIAASTDPLDITSYPILSDGDLNNDGQVDAGDVLLGQHVLMGSATLSAFRQGRGDVAPLVGGIPAPDGQFNLADLLVIVRKAVGLVAY
jgi:hypothetical protein